MSTRIFDITIGSIVTRVLSVCRLTWAVSVLCLYELVVAPAIGYAAMVFPPDPDPNNLNAFSLFLTEGTTAQPTVGFYRRGAGTPLMSIIGQMVPLANGGGVMYDLDPIAANINLNPGDVVLNDPATPTSPAMRSDILRFALLPGENRVHTVLFLSDPEQPGEPPFRDDTTAAGISIALQANNRTFDELPGVGAIDGISYVPAVATADPGFDPGGNIQSFVIISDVPEPGTILMMSIGLLGCAWLRRRAS
jgi:hypothetical protein